MKKYFALCFTVLAFFNLVTAQSFDGYIMITHARCTSFACFNPGIAATGFKLDDSAILPSGTSYVYRASGKYVSVYVLNDNSSSIISFGTNNITDFNIMVAEFMRNAFAIDGVVALEDGKEVAYRSPDYPGYSVDVQLRNKSSGRYMYIISARIDKGKKPAAITNWKVQNTAVATEQPIQQKRAVVPQKLDISDMFTYAKCENSDCFRSEAKSKGFIYSSTLANSGSGEQVFRFYGQDSILVWNNVYGANYAAIALANDNSYTRMEFATDARELYNELMMGFGWISKEFELIGSKDFSGYKQDTYTSKKYNGYKLETKVYLSKSGSYQFHINVTSARSTAVVVKKEPIAAVSPGRQATGSYLTVQNMFDLASCKNYQCINSYLSPSFKYRKTENGIIENDGKEYVYQTPDAVYGEKDHPTNNLATVYLSNNGELPQVTFATDNKAQYKKLLAEFITTKHFKAVATDKIDDGQTITYKIPGSKEAILQVTLHKSIKSNLWLYTFILQVN